MIVLEKNKVNTLSDKSVTLTTASDYVKMFTYPARSAVAFNISGKISGHDFGVSGEVNGGWNQATVTATLSQYSGGNNGLYAIRVSQDTAGGDFTFWLVFASAVTGVFEVETTLTSADAQSAVDLFKPVRLGSMTGTQKCTLDLYASGYESIWGTTGAGGEYKIPNPYIHIQDLNDGAGGGTGTHRTVGTMTVPTHMRGKTCLLSVMAYLDTSTGGAISLNWRITSGWGNSVLTEAVVREGRATGICNFYASNTPNTIELQMRADGEDAWIYNQTDRGRSIMTLTLVA